MTDDTIGIIASNLTIAYFSRYERVENLVHKQTETFGQFDSRESVKRDKIFRVFEHFKKELENRQSQSETGT